MRQMHTKRQSRDKFFLLQLPQHMLSELHAKTRQWTEIMFMYWRLFALTHFQRVRSQESDSDLVTRLGLGHIKPRMRLSPPLIHVATVPDGKGVGGWANCMWPSKCRIAKYLLCTFRLCWLVQSDLATAVNGRSMLQHPHGSFTALIRLTYFLPPSLPCAWSGGEGRGEETTRQEAADPQPNSSLHTYVHWEREIEHFMQSQMQLLKLHSINYSPAAITSKQINTKTLCLYLLCLSRSS